jgi:hypothetical protein
MIADRPASSVVTLPERGNRWLLAHASNVTSQNGEDGIIAKVLETIGDSTKWCVEFGAWDGRHLSNTFNLIASRGYSAVLIEGSKERFRELERTFKDDPKVRCVNAFVGFTAADGLDAILARAGIPKDFDVLSIDIDGNDYHVWKAVATYRPRVVVIEYNPTIPSAVDFVQVADMTVNQGRKRATSSSPRRSTIAFSCARSTSLRSGSATTRFKRFARTSRWSATFSTVLTAPYSSAAPASSAGTTCPIANRSYNTWRGRFGSSRTISRAS